MVDPYRCSACEARPLWMARLADRWMDAVRLCIALAVLLAAVASCGAVGWQHCWYKGT